MSCKLGEACCAVIGGRCKLYDYELCEEDSCGKDCKDYDEITNPQHYTDGDIQFIHAAESVLSHDEFLGFLRGNILKYVWRCEKKQDALKDMQKAHWYMCRYMDYVIRVEGDDAA